MPFNKAKCHPVDFTHTYEREGNTLILTLDHFCISEQLSARVLDAGVIHHPDNNSDHEPVYCVLQSITLSLSSSQPVASKARPSWKNASNEEKEIYKFVLERKLEAIMIPTEISECKNLHCKIEQHIEAVDWFSSEVLEAVQLAGEQTLPCPKTGSSETHKNRLTPGFSENVKPFKEKAYFWHQIWKSAGSPINTKLHRIMKRSRNVYHVEFKKCKKAKDACLNGNGELFKEIKLMRRMKPKQADTIDGVKDNIPNHFKDI